MQREASAQVACFHGIEDSGVMAAAAAEMADRMRMLPRRQMHIGIGIQE